MHVMVATDGSLDAKKAAAFAANLTAMRRARHRVDRRRGAAADARRHAPRPRLKQPQPAPSMSIRSIAGSRPGKAR